MGIRVGIDLGTTFSAVAMVDRLTGKPVIIKNSFNNTTTPSVLCFEENGNVLFGDDAKNMQAAGDPNTASFFKRSMGKDLFSVDIHGTAYNATDLSAILLKNLIKEAEANIGDRIDSAVITVPAYFSHKERAATIEAANKAGLQDVVLINEPTAAAFAYGLNESGVEQTILIYDLGGGTFDVTIARVNTQEIDVLGSDGNHELGGKDWDDCIARYLASEFNDKFGIDISEEPGMIDSLLVTAESVKKQLSSKDTATVPISCKGVKGTIEMTVDLFDSISQFLLGTTKDVIERLMQSLNMGWNAIDNVILVGGSTRMRMIHNYVKEMSGKPPLGGVDVDAAVALGAAIRANITSTGEVLPAIGGRSSGKTDALPAIAGAKAYKDAIAHSLGMISISEDGKRYVNSRIIPKNSKIPASETRPFKFWTRDEDNELEIYVLQGEFERPLDNTVVNKYVVTGIQKTTPPDSVINVSYKYTENGVIEVNAIQQETGKALPIQIHPVPEDMSWTDEPPEVSVETSRMQEADLLLAIDLSGSMMGEPIRKAKEAMIGFVEQMDSQFVRIGILAFADTVQCTLPLTNDYRSVIASIKSVDLARVGGANAGEPFTTAHSLLKKRLLGKSRDVRYLVVLTDGVWERQHEAISKAKRCHSDGIDVLALGFGSADCGFLEAIASVKEFASFTTLTELSGTFSKIAQAINVNRTGGLSV